MNQSMMHRRRSFPPLFAFFFFSFCLVLQNPVASAVDHSVAWSANGNYDTTDQTFSVGDTITFSWDGGHTVAVVSESSYEACAATSSDTVYTTSPAKIPLTEPGTLYFICTVPGHCSGSGMKLSVSVSSSASASGPSSSSSNSSSSAPPHPSSNFSFFPPILLIPLLFSLLGF